MHNKLKAIASLTAYSLKYYIPDELKFHLVTTNTTEGYLRENEL